MGGETGGTLNETRRGLQPRHLYLIQFAETRINRLTAL